MMTNDFAKTVQEIALYVPAFVFLLTFRGFFRALAATMMGDSTPRENGFLTLNPIAHVNPMGLLIFLSLLLFLGALFPPLVVLPLILIGMSIAGIYWTFDVPVFPANFSSPRLGRFLWGISGSFGSFVLALVMMYLVHYLPVALLGDTLSKVLILIARSTIGLAIIFGIFNLFPLPPFDGAEVVTALIPESWQPAWQTVEMYSIALLLFLLLFASQLFPLLDTLAESVHAILKLLVF